MHLAKCWDFETEKEFFSERGNVSKPRKQSSARKIPQEELFVNPKVNRKPKKRRGAGNAYQTTRSGERKDIPGINLASGWESNIIRVLQLFKIPYEYEPVEFEFPPTATGKTSFYIPDLYLPQTDEFLEVKGYLDSRGRNKLRKFKKYYKPEFSKLVVVISRSSRANKEFFHKLGVKKILYYENISTLYTDKIVNWEGRSWK